MPAFWRTSEDTEQTARLLPACIFFTGFFLEYPADYAYDLKGWP
jgi:hypothetical protein